MELPYLCLLVCIAGHAGTGEARAAGEIERSVSGQQRSELTRQFYSSFIKLKQEYYS